MSSVWIGSQGFRCVQYNISVYGWNKKSLIYRDKKNDSTKFQVLPIFFFCFMTAGWAEKLIRIENVIISANVTFKHWILQMCIMKHNQAYSIKPSKGAKLNCKVQERRKPNHEIVRLLSSGAGAVYNYGKIFLSDVHVWDIFVIMHAYRFQHSIFHIKDFLHQ